MIGNIGLAIKAAYYWFLWWLGMPDSDGNWNTIYDRLPITKLLRAQKARFGIWWYVLAMGTLFFVWELARHTSAWWWLGFALLAWLFVHVDMTPERRGR